MAFTASLWIFCVSCFVISTDDQAGSPDEESFYALVPDLDCTNVMTELADQTDGEEVQPEVSETENVQTLWVKRDSPVYQLPVGTNIYARPEIITEATTISVAVPMLPSTAHVEAAL